MVLLTALLSFNVVTDTVLLEMKSATNSWDFRFPP